MGQYDEVVERQRLLLAAEEWAEGCSGLHSHRLDSMWYDDRPDDTKNGQFVMDKHYNGGEIERTIYDQSGKKIGIHMFGERKTGDELIAEYSRFASDENPRGF
tara:strand:+ start:64 stop:372 length:309 start_codon:yes stop_codon:yes gene_type:complete